MRADPRHFSLVCVLAILLRICLPGQLSADTSAPDLRAQLAKLAAAHGFVVKGLQRLAGDPAKPADGNMRRQLEALLERYNFVLLHDAAGGIAEVRISGLKRAAPEVPRWHTVKTTRKGTHHVIEAVLVGPGGARQATSLIVDTGATTVVLPASMIETLGIHPDDLQDRWSQTANGRVRVKRGMLGSVEVGGLVVRDVAVVFVSDERIGGTKLLGMSFLGRFRFTIDDANSQMILISE